MAAVLEQKSDPGKRFDSQVDDQIAQATSRIRVHDLTLGGLTLAGMVVVYATGMILLDKSLNLPEWVRQLSLLGFLATAGWVAYLLIVRPLRKRINPLYAAARVEDTIEDAKNSVTGYVEAQEKGNVSPSVKAAMSARAARAVGEADVNRAVDHRSLLIAGGVLVVFLIILAVLFFVFRPTQFTSLIGRAFVPFSSDPIAAQTQLTLVKPENPEPTLTTGQTITVAVRITGRVPAKDAPDRVRVLIRHNPADPNYEELPLEQGDSSREWQLKVPEYLLQNGYWYKVAAGDTETREYKVTKRILPLFTDFEGSYEFPKYTRRPPQQFKGSDPNLRAYRGTKVTLVAHANRDVRDGVMKFEAPGLPPVVGKPTPGRPDSLTFTFTATEATRYRLHMTTTEGEANVDPPAYLISLDADSPPRVDIVKPEEPEATAPANGQLAVDGTVGDDFGIDKVRLRMKVGDRDLAPIPYEAGKSFRRDTDGTWPTNVTYKGSADLTKLTYADGQKFVPTENAVIEFWLEAIDNCTETKPVEGWGEKPQPGQVGRSQPRTLRLTAPRTEPEPQKRLADDKQNRQREEKQHNQEQQKKLDTENRQPEGQPEPPKNEGDAKPDGKPDPKAEQKTDPKAEGKTQDGGKPDPKTNTGTPPKGMPEGKGTDAGMSPKKNDETPGAKSDPTTPPMPTPKGTSDPKVETSPDPKQPEASPKTGTPSTGGMNPLEPKPMDTAPPPKSADDKKAEEDAKRVQEELNKTRGTGGDANPNPAANPEERTDPAAPKPQPMNAPPADAAEPKPAPKPTDPKTDPMGMTGEKNAAAESKPAGNLEKPTDPNPQPKPQPPADDKANPAESREAPLGGTPGQEKDKPEPKKNAAGTEPKPPEKEPKDSKDAKEPNKDPESGSTGKPCANPKPGGTNGNPGSAPDAKQPDPSEKAGAAKPNVDPARGQDKSPGQPKPGTAPPQEPRADADQDAAGAAKPQTPPPAAERKPGPPDAGTGAGQPPPSETKVPPKDPMNASGNAAAAEGRPENPQPKKGEPAPKGGKEGKDNNAVERGGDKPDPMSPAGPGGSGDAPPPKEKKDPASGGKKLSEKELKDLEKAAGDLDSPDPKKREEAEKALDKAIGEQQRKQLEQDVKDLKSDDQATRDAAKKRVEDRKAKAVELAKKQDDDAKKEPEGKGTDPKATEPKPGDPKATDPKGDEPKLSDEDVAELSKKLGDLNSKDEQKRKEAEKAFDEKIGKDGRERLQEELKKREEEELRKQFDDRFRKKPNGKGPLQKDWTPGGGSSSTDPSKQSETDPRNKAKTAQLQLEDFEKNRYNHDLQKKLGWTQEDMDRFLKAQADRAKAAQKEADAYESELLQRKSAPLGPPTLKTDSAGPVESRAGVVDATGNSTGAVFAPPGFEAAKKRFQEEAEKLRQKK